MNLHSPYPYAILRNGIINSYPSLQNNIKADIAIMGAGISGALVAWELQKAGFKTVVVDRRHAGMGSTAASTSLLQYEIDTPLHKLARMVGEKNAGRSYLLCRDAIDKIEKLCHQLPDKGLFRRRPSLQYASVDGHVKALQEEYSMRKTLGFSMRWLEQSDINKMFGFKKPAAILSKDGAEADAYRMTHSLLFEAIRKGLQVYDKTEIVKIEQQRKGVKLVTDAGHTILASKLIIACGYESQKYIPKKVENLNYTFAIASEVLDEKTLWYKNALIWETAKPYLYMRFTSDNRVIVGGKDIAYKASTNLSRLVPARAKALEISFGKLFPGKKILTDFKWVGTFAGTKDGLPYIGSIPQMPNTYFALGFGGNGITFSSIAAEIIRDQLIGKKNNDAQIFSFDR